VKTGRAGGQWATHVTHQRGGAYNRKTVKAVYSERGMERRIEVRKARYNVPYVRLANVDLELLNLRQAAGYSWRVWRTAHSSRGKEIFKGGSAALI